MSRGPGGGRPLPGFARAVAATAPPQGGAAALPAPPAFLKPQALPATTPRIGGITMEDLSARLEQLLSDPQMLSQLGELAAGLGLGMAPAPAAGTGRGSPRHSRSPPFWGCWAAQAAVPSPRLRSRPVGPHRPGDVLPFYPGPRYPAFDGFLALLRGAPPQKRWRRLPSCCASSGCCPCWRISPRRLKPLGLFSSLRPCRVNAYACKYLLLCPAPS